MANISSDYYSRSFIGKPKIPAESLAQFYGAPGYAEQFNQSYRQNQNQCRAWKKFGSRAMIIAESIVVWIIQVYVKYQFP